MNNYLMGNLTFDTSFTLGGGSEEEIVLEKGAHYRTLKLFERWGATVVNLEWNQPL